jgi:hypothetical protein
MCRSPELSAEARVVFPAQVSFAGFLRAQQVDPGAIIARRGDPARPRKCCGKNTKAGGSLRDVQLLAGHRSIQTTQRYIDGDSDAQRKLVSMI